LRADDVVQATRKERLPEQHPPEDCLVERANDAVWLSKGGRCGGVRTLALCGAGYSRVGRVVEGVCECGSPPALPEPAIPSPTMKVSYDERQALSLGYLIRHSRTFHTHTPPCPFAEARGTTTSRRLRGREKT
jgi:hypothetical protein